jgi:two-component system, NtrC family, nitrogen regulation sensor histidine kinase NtrY
MIVLIVVATVLLASISIIQFKNEAKEYHQERLERKENAIKSHINYVLNTTTYPLTTNNLELIFKDKIHELSHIHNIEVNIYNLDGHLLKSSKETFSIDESSMPIEKSILNNINESVQKRFVNVKTINGIKYRSAYSIIKDNKFKSLGILNLPYLEDDGYYDRELRNFLISLGQVYSFMLIVAFTLAYFLSSYITKSLKTISDKLYQTNLEQKNEKIVLNANSKEINSLIDAYNRMVDELEISATKLAQSEREGAWREMAKQVAHEIKNPLTPMRLTVQSFQRKFDPQNPEIHQKLKDYSDTLIQQIDTMNRVATAFSDFASMPAQQNESLNIVEVIDLTLDIFKDDAIVFQPESREIIAQFDRTQLIRILTNLVKNAIQSIPDEKPEKLIKVSVNQDAEHITIQVADNGVGIKEADKSRIFEPKFTTKDSGMGLGLSIIKNMIENYNGSIQFESEYGIGTVFTVKIPSTLN